MLYNEEVYDPDHMFFTEGEQMFYPGEMGYYPGEEMGYPDEMYYGDVYRGETYYGDVAQPIPIQSVMGPPGSLLHTYYGDD